MGEDETKPSGKNWKQGVVFVIVFTLLIVGCNTLFGGKTNDDNRDKTATEACQKSVRKQLAAPDTADFSDVTVRKDGDDLLVAGAVTAQTAAGGQDEQRWTCTATGDGDTWRGTAEITDL